MAASSGLLIMVSAGTRAKGLAAYVGDGSDHRGLVVSAALSAILFRRRTAA